MTALRVVDPPQKNGHANWWAAEPGDMWPCAWENHRAEYRSPCWVIRLPGRAWVWHTNARPSSGGDFWTVTGEPPQITVTPSINVGPDIWHGFITDGVLSPDEATS